MSDAPSTGTVLQWLGGIVTLFGGVVAHIYTKIDKLREALAADNRNDIRDIWQAIEADRRASQAYRELVLTRIGDMPTKVDIAALRSDLLAHLPPNYGHAD